MRPNKPLLYTAIGDSLSVGTGSFLAPGFEKRYAALAEHQLHHPVQIQIFAKNGATSADILHRLRSKKVHKSIYESSIITITAGGNDLIQAYRAYSKTRMVYVFEQAIRQFSENLSNIMQYIYSVKSSDTHLFMIRLVGLYNPFPHIQGSDYYVQSFNRHLQHFSGSNTSIADIYYPFRRYGKKLLSIDGLHPNGKGYQVIANVLNQTGYYPLNYPLAT
ncbi:MAG TPA: GDSL-type esterase/lipase family protein [Bacillales bacterium]|nr:GDSL-type esterase/lipase family protein [Bacillales bacterium]